ncbi:MAG: glycosyltransferase, partial [Flavobacteriia bacterium]|nr:glycosyltransferase [Flavobacteriia bacterium]
LSGAYMGLRKSVLEQTGLLDETFFMYGEDIDLSYRIQKAGFKNRYLSETTIIHYKGESTKKSSVNYVLVFYKAMIIFARKHFSNNHAFFFSFLIYAGIVVRAAAALVRRFAVIVLPTLTSSLISLAGLYALIYPWQLNDISFPKSALYWMIPLYWVIWASSNLLGGTYDPPFKPIKVIKSTFFATFVILVIYALLPKTLQFSRLYIVFGSLWFMLWILTDRFLRYWLLRESNGWNPRGKTRFLIVADKEEFTRIKTMILQQWSEVEYVHGAHLKEPYLESKSQGNTMIDEGNFGNYDEIIFSAKDLSARTIIHWMTSLVRTNVDFKIAQPETDFIIGSNSIEKPGEYYKININNLSRPENLRSKRFLDIITCLLLLMSSWAIVWFYRSKKGLFRNIYQVLASQKTWVGFFPSASQYTDPLLPRIKTGVLPPSIKHPEVSDELKDKLNLIYARDYSVSHDIKLILASLFHLDRS